MMVEDYNKSNSHQNTRERSKNSATMASPVLIPDESEVDLATVKDHWVKCGGISLNKRDLQRLTSGKELSDLHINAFQNLLRCNSVPLVDCRALFCSRISYLFQIKKKTTCKLLTYHLVLLLNTGLY